MRAAASPLFQVHEDEERKRQRAERFGVEYKPRDETGLMEVGALRRQAAGKGAVSCRCRLAAQLSCDCD
jgi:hypothetical protein